MPPPAGITTSSGPRPFGSGSKHTPRLREPYPASEGVQADERAVDAEGEADAVARAPVPDAPREATLSPGAGAARAPPARA
jgi:hypothetical protein